MAEEIKTNEGKVESTQEKRGYVIELKVPYRFEDKEYTEVDLGGLDRLTIKDAVDTQRQLFNEGEVASAMLCETTTAFARTIAAKASGMPIEFFKLMPRGKIGRAHV